MNYQHVFVAVALVAAIPQQSHTFTAPDLQIEDYGNQNIMRKYPHSITVTNKNITNEPDSY